MCSSYRTAFAHLTPGQKLIALGRGADVVDDRYPVTVVFSEVSEDAATAADYIQPHELGVIPVLPQEPEDTRGILLGDLADRVQVSLADVCRSLTDYLLDHALIHRRAELTQEALPDCDHALLGAVLLGEAFLLDRHPVVDVHDVHSAVADIAEHVDAAEPEQVFRHRGEALGEDVRAGEGHMIVEPAKREIDLFVLQEVSLEKP